MIPRDIGHLRALPESELPGLCRELREMLIRAIPRIGGHFASSLGAVELTVQLHRHFDTPNDRIVWDVGHQAYVHKILTGRTEALERIRRPGGVSGFLKRNESVFDPFGAGHAGTSISAALGMRLALNASDPDCYAVAVIGDGSLTAGMAFEALNHAGGLGRRSSGCVRRFIVVLNDNGMSISKNVGALHEGARQLEHALGIAGEQDMAMNAFAAALGFTYIGPVDGHSLAALSEALEESKRSELPVFLHVRTSKGKGHQLAEVDPIKWHGLAPAAPIASAPHPIALAAPRTYTQVFADSLVDLARADQRVIAITAAMSTGTGLDRFERIFPQRFYDVGICEQHAVTLAGGLAASGMRPVCAIYSTFLQRAYDQIIHDICIQNLPVTFVLDRGGLVGNDGETHQGVFDIAYLRTLPNMVVMSPKDEAELQRMLSAALQRNGPTALRFPRANGNLVHCSASSEPLLIGKGEMLAAGEDALLITFGPLAQAALSIRERALKEQGMSVAVLNARFAKPLDAALLREQLPKYAIVCTLEDHALEGGFSSAVLELINDSGIQLQAPIRRFGVPDRFITHGSQSDQQEWCGFDEKSVFSFLTACHQLRKVKAVA